MRILRWQPILVLLAVGVLIGLSAAPPAYALADVYVRTGGDDTLCDGSVDVDYSAGVAPACAFATIAKALTEVDASGTVHIAAGTFAESGLHITEAGVTVEGAGAGSTIVDPGGSGNVFFPEADDQTLKDLTIQNGTQGVRFEKAGSTIDNARIDNVAFLDNSSRGIEVHNDTTVTNLTVVDSVFIHDSGVGIRSASTGFIDGMDVIDSYFDGECNGGGADLGIYEANDNKTGTMKNIHIDNSEFYNYCFAAVYAEEIRDSLIENSYFGGNSRSVYIWKAYTTAGQDVANIVIRNNTFQDSTAAAVLLIIYDGGLTEDGISVYHNVFNQDVSYLVANWALVDLRQHVGNDYAPVKITKNEFNFSGSFSAGATATYAVKLRGELDNVTIYGNDMDGGGVTDGGVPPLSGVYLATTDGDTDFAAIPSTALVNIKCNDITGFVNGIAAYDPVGTAYGGLPTGATVNVHRNNIWGNSSYGLNNGPSSSSETIDATYNYWGAADGPSGEGPGSGDAISHNVDASSFLSFAAECGSIVVQKETDPSPNTTDSFGFSATGGLTPANFSLMDGDSQTFTDVDAGTYTITEDSALPDFVLVNVECESISGGSAITVDEAEVTIEFAAGDIVICTYSNAETVNLEDLLKNTKVETSYDSGSKVFTIEATFQNIGDNPLENLFFEVAQLDGPGCPCYVIGYGGAGSFIPIDLSPDGVLSPGEKFTHVFNLQLDHTSPFTFLVDIHGLEIELP